MRQVTFKLTVFSASLLLFQLKLIESDRSSILICLALFMDCESVIFKLIGQTVKWPPPLPPTIVGGNQLSLLLCQK